MAAVLPNLRLIMQGAIPLVEENSLIGSSFRNFVPSHLLLHLGGLLSHFTSFGECAVKFSHANIK